MKGKAFLLLNCSSILIMMIKISSLFSKISSIFPLYKLVIAGNINNFKLNKVYKDFSYEAKGIGIMFNNDSDISLMPMQLFHDIYKFYEIADDGLLYKIEALPNGLSQYFIFESNRPFEIIHLILEDSGITFPLKYLFFDKEEEEDFVYFFRFLSTEEQENIIIGKDLIELMNITFIDNNNFVINNKDFISKIEEDF